MKDTTDARIRFHAGRGMERHLLERIYGTFAVARVLGTPETAGISARRKTLGERLKAAREALGHTHNAVATILGGARADDIDSYEHGTKAIASPHRCRALAKYMGVDIKDFMRDLAEHNEKAKAHRQAKTARVMEIISAMPKRLPKPKKKRASTKAMGLTDAAFAEAVEMWRSGFGVTDMARATGVPPHIYHNALPKIRAAAEALALPNGARQD